MLDASSKQSQLSSSELWAQQKKKMGRLDAAIKAALAVSEFDGEHADLADSFANDHRSIKISIDEPLGFLVPWKACQTWRVSISHIKILETLLMAPVHGSLLSRMV